MGYIRVYNSKITYDIKLEHNINAVIDDSGTGKTAFVRAVERAITREVTTSIETSFSEVRVINSVDNLTVLGMKKNENNLDNTLVIIDEDALLNGVKLDTLYKTIKGTKATLIAITREISKLHLCQIPLNYKAVFVFKTENVNGASYTSLNRRYELNTNIVEFKPGQIYIEDGASGLEAFKKFTQYNLVDSNIGIDPLKGKDNVKIRKIIKLHNNKIIMIILDSCGIGIGLDKIKNDCEVFDKQHQIRIALYESFEWSVLQTNFIREAVINCSQQTQDVVNNIEKYRTEYLIGDENFYLKLLETITNELIGVKYGKSQGDIELILDINNKYTVKNKLEQLIRIYESVGAKFK